MKISVRKIGGRWQPVNSAGQVVRGDVYNADGTGYGTKEGATEAAAMLRLSGTRGGHTRSHATRLPDRYEIVETIDGDWMILIDGVQTGSKRDRSGAGSDTYPTYEAAHEAAVDLAYPSSTTGRRSHATAKDLSAVEDALGYAPEPGVVARAEATYGDYSTNELRREIQSLEDQFEMSGGRGVGLADRLDAARIALALRGSKGRRSHSTIAEVPSSSEFEKAKARGALLEKEEAEAGAVLNAFPRGPTGLTPDSVKATPEWKAAKARHQKAFARLREFNGVFVKKFAKELRAERAERTKERESRSGGR